MGAVMGAIAAAWVWLSPQPDIYIAADGKAAAVRNTGGRLSILHGGRDAFTIREWLAADADPRKPGDKSLAQGVRCDELGCVGRLADGRLVALPLTPDAFFEDCVRALVVVSSHDAPGECSALLLDRKVWRERGAMALRVTNGEVELQAARPAGYDRPWAPAPRRRVTPAPDATPPLDQLEPGD
jgi:competence protein ComEC